VILDSCNFCTTEINYHEIIDCITFALDTRDPYTGGHSQRVSDMALEVCKLLKLNQNDTEKIHIAAHLHDIGKIGIPDSILLKQGKLDDSEWQIMKNHPEIGANILKKSAYLTELAEIVLFHHERFDGKGYPEGKSGNDIPLGARIIAICDSIDALTSNRCYRKSLSFEDCYNQIKINLGKMYDPEIGKIVLDNWKNIIAKL
jgi:putative nucleotidyltransferase with HDIG domain